MNMALPQAVDGMAVDGVERHTLHIHFLFALAAQMIHKIHWLVPLCTHHFGTETDLSLSTWEKIM